MNLRYSTPGESLQALAGRPAPEQEAAGYFHTLREIRQQPDTWRDTALRMSGMKDRLQGLVDSTKAIALTGSGSSEYAGDCIRLPLLSALRRPVEVASGGVLVTHAQACLCPLRPLLLVSLARSGNSPESVGAVSLMLERDKGIHHLVLTANAEGRLATSWQDDDRVTVVTLDRRTCDQSLVMTSSFTNLVLAGAFLGMVEHPTAYVGAAETAAKAAEQLLNDGSEPLASLASSGFDRAVYLGSGALHGAAREGALKMLEMTEGRVSVMAESYLGLRHGPMSFLRRNSLLVCFLSSDPVLRAYELDLLHELDRKNLARRRLIVGDGVPREAAHEDDVVIDCPGLAGAGDVGAALLSVVASQLLAFYRCLNENLRPDSPSSTGVINRVVEAFALHRSAVNTVW